MKRRRKEEMGKAMHFAEGEATRKKLRCGGGKGGAPKVTARGRARLSVAESSGERKE